MSDSESETARFTRNDSLFSGEGPSDPRDFDRSADPFLSRSDRQYLCATAMVAGTLLMSYGIGRIRAFGVFLLTLGVMSAIARNAKDKNH